MQSYIPTLTEFSLTLLRLILIAVLILLAGRGLSLASQRIERRFTRLSDVEQMARLRTLLQTGRGVLYGLVLVIAGLMALQTLGINIAPLLAGAGVAGLAISLGAQTLIRDYIGGILILSENQFSVGDDIRVGAVEGTVEQIRLRATYLRALDGQRHIVPNGDIRVVSNCTADWARAVVDLDVAATSDMNAVMQSLERAAGQIQSDPAVKTALLEAPVAQSWVGFKDGKVLVRLLAKTVPNQHLAVAMALRRYAFEALRQDGIDVTPPTA